MNKIGAAIVAPIALKYVAVAYLGLYGAIENKIYRIQVQAMSWAGFAPITEGLTNEQLVDSSAKKWGIPVGISKCVAFAESRSQPTAYSLKGAIGIMQVMPFNAKRCSLPHAGKLWDEAKNIDCGNKILSEEYAKYKQWPNALRAYNGGQNCVKNRCGESEDYVKKVLRCSGSNTN